MKKIGWSPRARDLELELFLEAPKRVQKQSGTKCQVFKTQKKDELAILIPIRFDTPLGAAEETPKRGPKQTGYLNVKLKNQKNLPF